jgi:K+/H+ antiporter YhaU regulatory subunit KhtT
MYNMEVPKDIMPTLVIGLGGTGFQVIKRLKKLFDKRYNTKKLPIRYLIIDTDLKSFLDDDIDNNEKCQLRFGEGVKTTLDWAYNNPYFNWLPKNPPITPDFFTSTDQGAGLMRPIGRLYLAKNAQLVYDTLNTAKNDLVDLHKVLTDVGEAYLENIDRHKVYVVGSLAGGTGCGTFLDVAVMLSKVFNRDNTNIIGLFTLESCYDDKLSSDLDAQNRSKANCYAALKELEFFMSSITNPDDEKYSFNYNNIGEIKLEKKIFDICYLLENKNEMGGVLTNIEDIYDLCSLQLFQEVGTRLGSQLRADYANFICKDKDPVLKRDRHFSTFSSSSMEVPVENLRRYCAYRLTSEILSKINNSNEEDNTIEAAKALAEDINEALEITDRLKDFRGSNRYSGKKYSEFIGKKANLKKAENICDERYLQWKSDLEENKEQVSKLIKSFINEKAIEYGLNNLNKILMELKASLASDYENYADYNGKSAIDRANIENSMDNIKDKKVKSGKRDVDGKLISDFNKFIDQKFGELAYRIHKKKYDMAEEIIDDCRANINAVIGDINASITQVNNRLNKINYQANKKYGGNIISREMITREFYEHYYNENFGKNLTEKVAAMFKEVSIISVIREGKERLLAICEKEFDKIDSKINIMEILEQNAKNMDMSINDYVKEQLEITSKLSKPFWSAVKNPEVSWTECYYIGAIKDENITNGFTIKPQEPIDNWIRSQTGERSRQARYVETTNPYAIDVIHITMGACAAYLPDIKNYKQFYLRLLSSKAYPLHLDEAYVGLSDLDLDTEKLMEDYYLSLAYGVIINVDGDFVKNLRYDEGYKYIYTSPYCIEFEDSKELCEGFPENKATIDKKLILGTSQEEVLKRLADDKQLVKLIRDFIATIEKSFKKEQLKEHMIKFVSDEVNEKDFIAYEKIKYKTSV